MLCKNTFCRFILHSQRSRRKLFWTTLKEINLTCRKRMELLEGTELLCVRRSKTLDDSSVQRHKILKEWIQRLCSNVVYSLFMATSQSLNDHMDRCSVSIPVNYFSSESQLCTKRTDCIKSRGDLKISMCAFWSSTSRPCLF